MTPNEVYKTNPNSPEWMEMTLACGKAVPGVEFGKCYFIAYANAAADDNYPMIFPYSVANNQLVAIALHAVPKSYYESVRKHIEALKASTAKKNADLAQIAKETGQKMGVFTRRYFPNLFKKIYHVGNMDKAYGLWLSLSGQ